MILFYQYNYDISQAVCQCLFEPSFVKKPENNAVCNPKSTDRQKSIERTDRFPYNNITEGGGKMQVEIKIDASYDEPKIIILTNSLTDEINSVMQMLSDKNSKIIFGNKNGKVEILCQEDLLTIYAANGKVYAVTDTGEYSLRLRLYEAEKRLNPSDFIRISNSEIINLKKVKCFDLNLVGTISVEFINGTTTYVSRRYVSKIKKLLRM